MKKNKEKNGFPYPGLSEHPPQEEREDEKTHLFTEEVDHLILMHRDAHFGGDFNVMIKYYQDEGIGVHPELELERILYLAQIEKELGEDLAPLILTGPEAESVARARQAYTQLKDLYEITEEKSPFPRLIADLILSEEEEPTAALEAVVSQGTRIVPELIALVKSDQAYDPLFPGYGHAPYLAMLALGKIKDPAAIIPLFESMGKEFIFDEMVILESLAQIGEPAKEFLLTTLKGRPITQDNTHAAFALTAFANDPQVAIASFEQLQEEEVQKIPLLRTYLLCNCETLKNTSHRESFIKMAENPALPSGLRKEIKDITQDWDLH